MKQKKVVDSISADKLNGDVIKIFFQELKQKNLVIVPTIISR